MPSASAALVSSHSLRVSSLMNLSSNSFRSCCTAQSQSGEARPARRRRRNLIGAACSAVKAAILQNQAEHLRSDLRCGAASGDCAGEAADNCSPALGAAAAPRVCPQRPRKAPGRAAWAKPAQPTARRAPKHSEAGQAGMASLAPARFTDLALDLVNDAVRILHPHRRRACASRAFATVVHCHHLACLGDLHAGRGADGRRRKASVIIWPTRNLLQQHSARRVRQPCTTHGWRALAAPCPCKSTALARVTEAHAPGSEREVTNIAL